MIPDLNIKIHFGKHEGCYLDEIPIDYLEHLFWNHKISVERRKKAHRILDVKTNNLIAAIRIILGIRDLTENDFIEHSKKYPNFDIENFRKWYYENKDDYPHLVTVSQFIKAKKSADWRMLPVVQSVGLTYEHFQAHKAKFPSFDIDECYQFYLENKHEPYVYYAKTVAAVNRCRHRSISLSRLAEKD